MRLPCVDDLGDGNDVLGEAQLLSTLADRAPLPQWNDETFIIKPGGTYKALSYTSRRGCASSPIMVRAPVWFRSETFHFVN
jgi:hypothetical protein